MKAGIAIDDWKFEIFERHLRQAGYTFSRMPFVEGTLMLHVETDNAVALAEVVKAANTEAAMTGAPR